MSDCIKLYPERKTEEFNKAHADFYPNGRVFTSKNIKGKNLKKLIDSTGVEFSRINDFILNTSYEMDIRCSEELITEWESAYGIPDDCFKNSVSLQQRRNQVIAKMFAPGAQSKEDFEIIAKILAFNINIIPGGDANRFPYTWPITFQSDKTSKFTVIIQVDTNGLPYESFPYTWPITFGFPDVSPLECFFKKLVSIDVLVVFEFVELTPNLWSTIDDIWSDISTMWSLT